MIRKYQNGNPISPGLYSLSINTQTPNVIKPIPQISSYQGNLKQQIQDTLKLSYINNSTKPQTQNTTFGNQLASSGINAATNYLSNIFQNKLLGEENDSDIGRTMGALFSTGISSAGNTMADNLLKGQALTQGLGQNVGASLAGAGAGIAANYIGQGITSAMGDSRLGRAVGSGVATGLGTIGGKAASDLIMNGSVGNLFKGAGSINPYALAASVTGSAMGAAAGPSKEYSGKYGKAVQIADAIYDGLTVAANAIPGYGQFISASMSLNKGQSNLLGSTDGMTLQDAIIGSSFMPAPVKWVNVLGSRTTSSFNNQSWQNTQKTNAFMGNSFGSLADRFKAAREEAGKTYGTFSRSEYNEAQDNINFANNAWNKILAMANKNELQDIRSQAMSSINNQRYAQNIQGGYNSIYRGKLGMKIFNNATNHNIGMRLLSGAALIDNKQMILCSVVD